MTRKWLHSGVLVALGAMVLAAVAGPTPAATANGLLRPAVPQETAPDPLSAYRGQVSCDPVAKPGAVALRSLVLTYYGIGRDGGITRMCGSSISEHMEGRAWDWMLNVGVPAQKAAGDDFVTWLTGPDAHGVPAGNARRLGVMYVIWNRQTWQAWTGSWKPYTGASAHTDHVHVSLSWDGAFQRTSWWTGRAIERQDVGPCRLYSGEPAPPYSGPRYSPCPTVYPRPTQQLATSLALDLNDDNLPDTLGRAKGGGALYYYPGSTTGAAAAKVYAGAGWDTLDVLAPTADVTGDSVPDMWGRERATGILWLYTGSGTGDYVSRRPVGTGWTMHDALLTAGDVTGDGVADLWARDKSTGTLWLYTGDGSGAFRSVRAIGTGWAMHDALLTAGDVTGDGIADLWSREKATGTLWLYAGDGAGGFASRRVVGTGWGMHSVLVGMRDADGDRIPEVFGVEAATGRRWFYRGDGAGGFVSRRLVDSGWGTLDLVV